MVFLFEDFLISVCFVGDGDGCGDGWLYVFFVL